MEPSKNSAPAKALKAFLKSKGIEIPHTLALEALAHAGGYKNRHELRAEEKAAAPGLLPRPQEIKVWVVKIDHRHGSNVSTYATRGEAFADVAAYARENWPDEIPGEPMPTSDDEVVRQYFETLREHMGNAEFYEIEESVLVLPAGAPPGGVPVVVERPEFAGAETEPSLHETLGLLMAGMSTLPAAHQKNAAQIAECLQKQRGQSTLTLASLLLRERGAYIVHMETVDGLQEQMEGGDDPVPARTVLHDAVRVCATKYGMADSAVEAYRDMMQRVAVGYAAEDAAKEQPRP